MGEYNGEFNYDEELERIDASIADLKVKDMASARDRTRMASQIQAARFQRDILAHASQSKKVKNARRSPESVEESAPPVRVAPQRSLVALLGVITMLLPRFCRERYFEEWRGELHDMRAEGDQFWTRIRYVVAILLYSAPILAVNLRRGGRRAVDW